MPHKQPVIPVQATDGHRFDLIHVPSSRAKQALLFLPGMGLSARLFIPFARALAERGIEVFIHEWRGNGSSNWRASRDCNWGYAELLEDLGAARATVAERVDGDFLLGGHSLGSQLACLSAAADAGSLSGLLVIAGGTPYWRAFGWPVQGMIMATMFAFPTLGTLFGYYPGKRVGFAGNEARGIMADWARSARTGRYRPGGVEGNLEAGLRALELPVLAVNMAGDWLGSRGSLNWLTAKLENCTVTTRVIDADIQGAKADHYAWMKHPAATANIIDAWLSEMIERPNPVTPDRASQPPAARKHAP